jgi:hypothetical protein
VSIRKIPFELHITIDNLLHAELDGFLRFCNRHEAKPLLIELSRGDFIHQPMFNKVVFFETLEDALKEATAISLALNAGKFNVKRLKIEVPSDYSALQNEFKSNYQPYFEWHGKVDCHQSDVLLELCLQHQVHLSVNALKKEANTRFVTLREFGNKTVFEQRIKNVIDALRAGGWPVIKQQSEFCVYDNNVFLDNGWLPQ